jgi:MFS family permease
MNDAESSLESAGPPPLNPPEDAYAVLRNRDFVLFLIGRLVSSLGQQMIPVAIGWEIYERTNSVLNLGYVGLTQMVPMLLFTLPAGHLADNHNRKRIVMLMLLGIAVSSIGLTLISALRAPVAWIYLCLFTAGTARTFLWPASASFLPQLVSRKNFPRAVIWSSGSFQLSSVAGPAVGGGLIALTGHAAPVYALNALFSLTFFALLAFVHYQRPETAKEKMTLHSLLAGIHFVFANKIILGIITLDLFAVLLGGATALLPVYAKDILQSGPAGLGFLIGALPCGAVLCTLILAHRPPMQRAGRSMLWAVTIFGVATILFGIANQQWLGKWIVHILNLSVPKVFWFWFSFAMLFVCGAVDNISVVVRHTLVQLLTPDEKRGRVSAVNSLFIGTSNELGGTESSFVAYLFGQAIGNSGATGAILSVVSGGVGTMLVVVAVALIWPQIRKYGRLDGS